MNQADGSVSGSLSHRLAAEEARHGAVQSLLSGQNRLLEMIARDMPLKKVLEDLTRLIEAHSREMLCSVLLLDSDGLHLRHGAAPSLPEQYNQAIDGITIGPSAGSCGTAAFLRQPVIVSDIATDPLWEGYREQVLPYGLRACWSTPIISSTGNVLGTFAMYYREPRHPSPFDLELIGIATRIAGIAIARHQSEERLRKSEQRLVEAQRVAHIGSWEWDIPANFVTWSDELYRIFGLMPQGFSATYEGFLERVAPDDRPHVRATIEAGVRTLEPFSYEARIVRPDGAARIIYVQGACRRNVAGGPAARMIGICQDITERKRVEGERARLFESEQAARAEAQAALDRLQELSRRLVDLQEAERRAIARELHDEIGQKLTGLKLLLESGWHSRHPETEGHGEGRSLEEMTVLINDLMRRVRELSMNLRPAMLDDLGLVPALHWHLERFTAQTAVRVDFRHSGIERRLPPEIETAAFRIVQEALTNVARHAGVGEATVQVWASRDRLGITVEDRGRGFDLESALSWASSGLAGMRERTQLLGGGLTIDTTPGSGTRLTAELPIAASPPTAADPQEMEP